VKALRILAAVGYPFLVFTALSLFHARAVALVLGAALAIRVAAGFRRLDREHVRRVLPLVGLVGVVLLMAAVFNEGRLLLFVPSLVNIALLIAFARTLMGGPSMVEMFARSQGHRMSDVKIRYCRIVTALWCAFFALNSGVILLLALYASIAWWTAYTGLVAYILIGLLFTAEVLYRAWRFRDYREGAIDGVLRRLFPPRDLARCPGC